jgi:hypothetical protein
VKQLILPILALSIAAFAPVGSRQCGEMHEQVMAPISNVVSFLKMNPDMDIMSTSGCLYVLGQLKQLPAGSQLMRELGARAVENTQSRCVTVVSSIHYPCTEPKTGEARCLPQAYSYCGQWAYSMTNQPKYEAAMELSTQVEVAYDKAQQMCGMAMRHDRAGATSAAGELLRYLTSIQPQNDRVYSLTCGE